MDGSKEPEVKGKASNLKYAIEEAHAQLPLGSAFGNGKTQMDFVGGLQSLQSFKRSWSSKQHLGDEGADSKSHRRRALQQSNIKKKWGGGDRFFFADKLPLISHHGIYVKPC